MRFNARLPENFADQLDGLNDKMKAGVLNRIEELTENPKLGKKLTDKEVWSDRVGKYRIIYLVNWSEQIINFLTIDKRGRVYKR